MAVSRFLAPAGLRPPTADEILGLARQLGLPASSMGLLSASYAPGGSPTTSAGPEGGLGGRGSLAVRAILNALVAAPPVGNLRARANASPSLVPATSTGMAGLPSATPPFAAAGLTTSTGLADGTARPTPRPKAAPRKPPARRTAPTAPSGSDPAPTDGLHAQLLNAEAGIRAYRNGGGHPPKGFPLPLAQYQEVYSRVRRAILGNPVGPSLPVGGGAAPGLGTSTGLPNLPPSAPSLSRGSGPVTSTAKASVRPLPGSAWYPPDDGLAELRAYNTPARLAAASRAMNPRAGGTGAGVPIPRIHGRGLRSRGRRSSGALTTEGPCWTATVTPFRWTGRFGSCRGCSKAVGTTRRATRARRRVSRPRATGRRGTWSGSSGPTPAGASRPSRTRPGLRASR